MTVDWTRLPLLAFADGTDAAAWMENPFPLWGIRLRDAALPDAEYARVLSLLMDRAATLPAAERPRVITDFRPGRPLPGCPWGVSLRMDQAPLWTPDMPEPVGSAHSVEDLETLSARGVRYAVLSPIFPPRTPKVGPSRPPLGPGYLAAACRRFPALRILALGGVGAETAGELEGTGCFGLAGIGWLRERLRTTRR